jgi:4-amino-4-deoxy-L-arabinose transferase-like glycosyltransferase
VTGRAAAAGAGVDAAGAAEAADAAGAAGGREAAGAGAARRLAQTRTLVFLATVAGIAVAAAILRFAEIATNPGGLYGDEAAEGLDALLMLRQPGFHPDWLVWFQDDGGREALFAYVVAAAFTLFGDSALILRETAAAIGVAGVLAIAALAGRWGKVTALVAAAWAAGSLWLICVSRDGMRNTIVPFFGAIALIAILRWAARPNRATAILAGAVTSLSTFYTYQPLKLLPLLVVIWLIWLRHADRPKYLQLRAGIPAAIVAFVVVGFPMLAVAVTEPASYFGRATAVSVFNPAVVSDVPYPIHVLRTVLMFGFFGDGNGRHDVASLPLLPIPLALVGLLGLRRLWRRRSDPADSLILLSLGVFMLPLLLFPDGYSPHFLRALGLAAPLGVTIGLGTMELVDLARRRRPDTSWAPGLAAALVAVTLAGVAVWSGYVYLNRSVADRWEPFSYPASALADAAREQPNTAVILGGFDVVDIQFLDYHAMPAIIDPETVIPNPRVYSRILAPTRPDLFRSLGAELAAKAIPVAFDPSGQPVVWAVTP